MLLKLLMEIRKNEPKENRTHSDKFLSNAHNWFFCIREDTEVGPFNSHPDTEHALLHFIGRNEWPMSEKLSEFIEDCRVNTGINLYLRIQPHNMQATPKPNHHSLSIDSKETFHRA